MTDSTGQWIHRTDEGIRNFRRWFNGFRRAGLVGTTGQGPNVGRIWGADNGTAGGVVGRDERGRARILFDGTEDRRRVYGPYHPNRKTKGWLVRLQASCFKRK